MSLHLCFKNDLSGIEIKIKQIEKDLERNHETINKIKETVKEIANGDPNSLKRLRDALDSNLKVCTKFIFFLCLTVCFDFSTDLSYN